MESLAVVGRGAFGGMKPDGGAVGVNALLVPGARSVVHVLETDLQDLLRALGTPLDAVKVPPEGAKVVRHESLRGLVTAGFEGKIGTDANIIIARWDSTLKDEPESVTHDKLYRPWDHVASAGVGLESANLWGKATFLAKNPAFERAITCALRDFDFLCQMVLTDFSNNVDQRQRNDPEDAGDEALDQEWRAAARSANRLRYIHAAIEELRKIHDRQGSIVVPDRNPYHALTQEDSERAIIVIRPHFAEIDMSLAGSDWELKNQWFEDCLVGYCKYRWDGGGD